MNTNLKQIIENGNDNGEIQEVNEMEYEKKSRVYFQTKKAMII